MLVGRAGAAPGWAGGYVFVVVLAVVVGGGGFGWVVEVWGVVPDALVPVFSGLEV